MGKQKPTTANSSTKAKTSAKAAKKLPLATSMMISVLAIIIAFIAYKQIFLVSHITSNLPEEALKQNIEACVKVNFTSEMLTSLSPNNAFFDLKGVLNSVLQGISTSVLANTMVKNNLITEVKVVKIDDFFGKNAQIDVTGSIDVIAHVPVIGETQSNKEYKLSLIKRGSEHYFDTLSVKDREATQWTDWACAKKM